MKKAEVGPKEKFYLTLYPRENNIHWIDHDEEVGFVEKNKIIMIINYMNSPNIFTICTPE